MSVVLSQVLATPGASSISVSFALSNATWWVGVVIVACVVAVWIGVRDVQRRSVEQNTRVRSWWLIALRVIAAVAIALIALQPHWPEQQVVTSQGQIALLVDRSRSMAVRVGDVSRQDQAKALIERWLGQDIPTRMYAFGNRLTPLSPNELSADASLQEGTAIGAAIEELAQGFGSELGAVVVLSDGHETSKALDSSKLATLGVRVHTVAVGAEQARDDDAIVDVQAPAVAFVHQAARVRVVVRAPGRAGQTMQVMLRRDDEVIADALVEVGLDGSGSAEFEVWPSRVGRELYRVEIATAANDPVPENNERALVVRVARDRTRVLLVSGRPGWDARYLRGLLNADPAVDLITFFILRTANDLPMASPQEMSLIPFPTDELFREHLSSFDAVIFQDFEYGPYEMARYLPGIAEYVKRGGSFAMIGGSQSFGAGGYARTPLAEVLPVRLTDGFDAIEGAFRPVIASDAGEHPIVRLSNDISSNRALWQGLAPMLGFHRFVALQGDAQALLEHPSARLSSGVAAPVLVVSAAGAGRVLALGVDTSWRWGITSAASSGDASVYERFWDRALRWLTRDPMLEPSQLDTDQERYAPGAPIGITGVFRDARYVPLSSQAITIEAHDKLDNVIGAAQATTDHEGRATLKLDAPGALGGYRLIARAHDAARAEDEQPLAEQYVVVERGGPELADVTARPEVLSRLSAITGGQHFASIDQAPALAELERSRSRVVGTRVHAPFKAPWFVVLTVGVLALEWWLRRRAGLR